MELKIYFKEHGMLQTTFCKKLGIGTATLWRWVNKVTRPRKSDIMMIEKITYGEVTEKDWPPIEKNKKQNKNENNKVGNFNG